jgi:hypothetical protein
MKKPPGQREREGARGISIGCRGEKGAHGDKRRPHQSPRIVAEDRFEYLCMLLEQNQSGDE